MSTFEPNQSSSSLFANLANELSARSLIPEDRKAKFVSDLQLEIATMIRSGRMSFDMVREIVDTYSSWIVEQVEIRTERFENFVFIEDMWRCSFALVIQLIDELVKGRFLTTLSDTCLWLVQKGPSQEKAVCRSPVELNQEIVGVIDTQIGVLYDPGFHEVQRLKGEMSVRLAEVLFTAHSKGVVVVPSYVICKAIEDISRHGERSLGSWRDFLRSNKEVTNLLSQRMRRLCEQLKPLKWTTKSRLTVDSDGEKVRGYSFVA